MRKKNLTYLWCLLMMLLSFSVFSQAPPVPPPPPPVGLPIDGGLSLLLIAGASYGVYVIKKRLKCSKN